MIPSWLARLRGLVTLAVILALGATIVLSISPSVYTDADDFLEVIRSFGASSFLLFVLVGLVRPITLIPASIYAVAAGALFGTLLGTTAAMIGQMGGVLVAFYLSRRLGGEGVKTLLGDRLSRISPQSGFTAVVVGRMMPIFPGDVVSIAAGLSGMKPGPYAVASLIGMAIPVTVLAMLGDAVSSRNQAAIWLTVALLALLIITSLLVRRLRGAGGREK